MAIAQVEVVQPPKEQIEVPNSSAPLKLTGWDHIAIVVPDLVAAEQWYVDVLGGEVVGRYNWGGDSSHRVTPHEDIRIGANVLSLFHGDPTRSQPRMIHYAFNCRGMEELDTWKAHLERKGVATRGPMAHDGFGAVSVYFEDPWGYRLEIATWLPDFETAKAEALKREGGGIMGGGG